MEKKKGSTTTSKKSNATKTKNVVKDEVKTVSENKEIIKQSTKRNNHDTFKVLAIVILVVAVITWFIKTGTWDYGSASDAAVTFTQNESAVTTGINELFLSIYYGINYYLVQIVFLVALGIFYGIISKTNGYKAMVKKCASLFKSREVLFTLITSLIIAILTSFITQPIVVITFIPLIYSIAKELKINKVTAMLMTYGSLAVGLMGLTYGTYGTYYASQNLGIELTSGILYRAIILVVGYLLINIFMVLFNKKNTNAEIAEDNFELSESNAKAASWPYFLMFAFLFIITILGYIQFDNIFNNETFANFHNWLTTEIVVGENQTPIIGQILGNVGAFGTWDPFVISYIFLIIVIIIVFVKKIKKLTSKDFKKLLIDLGIVIVVIAVCELLKFTKAFEFVNFGMLAAAISVTYLLIRFFLNKNISVVDDEIIENALSGLKKVIKPIVLITLAYSVFVLCYWSGITTNIVNFFNSGNNFSPYLTALGNTIADFLHVDVEYTGFVLGQFYAAKYAQHTEQILAIMSATSGLVALIAPTSIFMLTGLSLSNMSYKDYFKAIWKFLIALVIVLCVVFTIITFM
ncbi:MAG: hypothetical protein IJ572_04770 [Bacilli bacterium]|nr:hypothetical protein [Bacilli bacterium]